MPYTIHPHMTHRVYRAQAGRPVGEILGEHATRKEALAQIAELESGEEMQSPTEKRKAHAEEQPAPLDETAGGLLI